MRIIMKTYDIESWELNYSYHDIIGYVIYIYTIWKGPPPLQVND